MTIQNALVYAALILIHYVLKGFLAVYIVDGVLKYEIKYKRSIYAICMILCGVYSMIWVGVHLYSGYAITDLDVDEDFMVHAALTFLILVFVKTKWWKKIFVSFSALETLAVIEDIFIVIRDQLDQTLAWKGDAIRTAIFVLAVINLLVIEFGFFYLLKQMRSKHDNKPMPLLIVVAVSILMNLIVSMMKDMYQALDLEYIRGIILSMVLIMMLVMLALFFYIRVNRKERDDLKAINKINEQLVASQAKFFEATARSDNEIRAMRHDMRNNIQVLMLLLEQGEHDKMREYLKEMGDNLISADVSAHTGDMIADAIIADKKAEAESRGLRLKSIGKIEGIEISPVDMCKILANTLDNAIEAASMPELKDIEESDKLIDLQFKKTDNFFMISVTNPCFKAPRTKDGKVVTSKEDSKNHGFGIQNIESAAASYGGELNFSCDEKPYGFLFRSELVFPIP